MVLFSIIMEKINSKLEGGRVVSEGLSAVVGEDPESG